MWLGAPAGNPAGPAARTSDATTAFRLIAPTIQGVQKHAQHQASACTRVPAETERRPHPMERIAMNKDLAISRPAMRPDSCCWQASALALRA